MGNSVRCLLFFVLCLIFPSLTHAQEEQKEVITNGNRYISFKIKSLDKYNDRLRKQQEHLLNKLKRKENRFAQKLKNKDSLGYARYQRQSFSYDSISKLAHPDSAALAQKSTRRNILTDSLKGISSFLQSKSGGIVTNTSQVNTNNADVNRLQGELNYRKYINDLISQRTNTLKNLAGNSHIPVFTGIEKQVFYSKQKMNVFKEMEEEPSKAEDKAYEYLQGTNGFDKYMDKASAGPNSMQGIGSNTSATDLQKMGFQTKQQMQTALQQKFGGNLTGLSQKMGDQIKAFQDKTQDINTAKQSLQSLTQLKHINKPSFKINPMRGLPFWKRIEKQYNFQTTRATIDGTPAILQLSAMAGYKQSPKLSYGIGVVESTGLGQNWSSVKLTFQGIGFRTYAAWQWQYGIGAYGGYERMYKQASVSNTTGTIGTDQTPHSTNNYNESILIGLTKSYNINTKWNGAVQLLYDVWWQQKGLQSPIVLRFSTISK